MHKYGKTTLLLPVFVLCPVAMKAQMSGRVFREFNMHGVGDAAITSSFRDQANDNATTITTPLAEAGLSGATNTAYDDNEVLRLLRGNGTTRFGSFNSLKL